MNSFLRCFSVLLLFTSATYAALAEPASSASGVKDLSPAQHSRVVEGYGKLPLSFEPNQGQADSQVKFLSRGDGYSLFLTSSEAVLSLRGKSCPEHSRPSAIGRSADALHPCAASSNSVLRMSLLGSNRNARIEGQDALPGKSNYFMGRVSSTWHTNVANYRKVQYQDVYPGIDLVYYGNQRQLEHDFIVAPGADPNTIRFRVGGSRHVSVRPDGDLVIATPNGDVELHRPVVYQDVAGLKVPVTGGYRLQGNEQIGFDIANYNRSLPLVIDPVLVYSTYFGGPTLGSKPTGIAVDKQGNAYITGTTPSDDFPLVNPIFSTGPTEQRAIAFISKLNTEGTALLYSTYFGSNSAAEPQGIAVDKQGNAYITGSAQAGLPVVNAIQPQLIGAYDAFVSKISADGSELLYSTYLGVWPSGGSGIAVDATGAAYVTGFSAGGISTVNPAFPRLASGGFLAKLDPSGQSFLYSTYLQALDVSSVAVDALGEAIVAGTTNSQFFPVVNALYPKCKIYFPADPSCYDTFVAKFNTEGSALIYSTYLVANNGGASVATNAAGDAFVSGIAEDGTLPIVNALFPSLVGPGPFVMRINPSGSKILYSTYLNVGGSIAVDAADNVYLAGSASADFPTVDALQTSRHGPNDTEAFITKISAAGSALVYSTYLGGSGMDYAAGIAVSDEGEAYIAGQTGSKDFPLINALQNKPSLPGPFGFDDGFIAKISGQTAKFLITDTVDQTTVRPGGDLHYTITVTNSGSEAASGVVQVTSLRDRFRTCTVSNGYPCNFTVLGGTATVEVSSLAKGNTRTVLIYATAAKTAGDYNLITNTASITPANSSSEKDSASSTVTVRESADIGITSNLVDSTAGVLHYLHTITNAGPDNSHAVLFLSPLPAHTAFVSASTTAGQCRFKPTIGTYGSVRCPLNNPDANASVKVDIVLQAFREACPSVTNTTAITSQSIDQNSGNDSTAITSSLPQSFCTPQPPPQYKVSIFNYDDVRWGARYLNNNGDLLGFVPTSSASFIYKSNAAQPTVFYNANSQFYATGFNDLDEVIGFTYSYETDTRQSYLYKNGQFKPLNLGSQFAGRVAEVINNSDQIAGTASAHNGSASAAFIYQNGVTTDLGHLPNAVYTGVTSINKKGEITGSSGPKYTNLSAFVYTHGLLLNISPSDGAKGSGVGIDSSGRVAGSFTTLSPQVTSGFIYSGGLFTDLVLASANGINDCGEVVGTNHYGPYLYRHGMFADLSNVFPFPGNLFNPITINNRGQILGTVTGQGGQGPQGPAVALLTPTALEKCGSDATIDNNPSVATITTGGTITYTIKAVNLDTATTQFTVKDALDPTTTVVSCTVNGGGGTCAATPGSHSVSVVLPNLSKGSTATIIVKAKSAETYSSESVVMNTATLSSSLSADYLSTAYTSVQ